MRHIRHIFDVFDILDIFDLFDLFDLFNVFNVFDIYHVLDTSVISNSLGVVSLHACVHDLGTYANLAFQHLRTELRPMYYKVQGYIKNVMIITIFAMVKHLPAVRIPDQACYGVPCTNYGDLRQTVYRLQSKDIFIPCELRSEIWNTLL